METKPPKTKRLPLATMTCSPVIAEGWGYYNAQKVLCYDADEKRAMQNAYGWCEPRHFQVTIHKANVNLRHTENQNTNNDTN
jgi:hypothetical protein